MLTNLPPLPGLDYASLKAKRDDVILLRLTGNRDGSAAVDYTVNAASGFPLVTGNNTGSGAGALPVNHVLPAWDIAAGLYLATALLAAERHRARTGEGQEVTAALSDVMLATVGHLGYVGDVHINGTGAAGDRQRSLRQFRARFRDRRRPPRDDHRADPAAMARDRPRHRACRQAGDDRRQ